MRTWALALAGFNLMLLQLLYVRELAACVGSSELAILCVLLAYFAGLSLGYLIGARLPSAWVRLGWLAALAVHLPLLAGLRAGVAFLRAQGMGWPGQVAMLGLACLLVSSFYSVLLPRALEQRARLEVAYSAELGGALAALALLAVLPQETAPFVYVLALLGLGAGLGLSRPWMVGGAVAGMLALSLGGPLDRVSTLYAYGTWFDDLRPWQQLRLLDVRRSPYQKSEVLESGSGGRFLFLNGLMYFNDTDLEWYNVYLSEIPARLRPGSRVLIVGAGSMSGVGKVSETARSITTVELDRQVAELGRKYFPDYNHLEGLGVPWSLVVDDAKHYLASTDEKFDLILMDVPGPFYLQTGLLCTEEFYRLCRSRLNPGGLVAVCLAEDFEPGGTNEVSGPILKALSEVFPCVTAVNGRETGLGFAYAGDRPVDRYELRRAALLSGAHRAERVPELDLEDQSPVTVDDLRIVWRLNRWSMEP